MCLRTPNLPRQKIAEMQGLSKKGSMGHSGTLKSEIKRKIKTRKLQK